MEVELETSFDLNSRVLPDDISLQMIDFQGNVYFETTGKWLHPLFDLEIFIKEKGVDTTGYVLHDRIAGKAAAAITTRLGFRYAKAEMMSMLAASLYEHHGVRYTYTTLIDRIMCQTESLFENIDDVNEIYRLVEQRRNTIRIK